MQQDTIQLHSLFVHVSSLVKTTRFPLKRKSRELVVYCSSIRHLSISLTASLACKRM